MKGYKGGRGNCVLPLFSQQDQYALTRHEYFIVESYSSKLSVLRRLLISFFFFLALRRAWPQLNPRAGVTAIAAGTI